MMLQTTYRYNPQDVFDNCNGLLYQMKAELNKDLPSGSPITEIGFEGFVPFDPKAKQATFKVTYRQNVGKSVTLYVRETRKQDPTQRHTFQSTFETISEAEFEQLKKN